MGRKAVCEGALDPPIVDRLGRTMPEQTPSFIGVDIWIGLGEHDDLGVRRSSGVNSNLCGEGVGDAFVDAGDGQMILEAVPISPSSFDSPSITICLSGTVNHDVPALIGVDGRVGLAKYNNLNVRWSAGMDPESGREGVGIPFGETRGWQ